jgi:hypothetical protein
MIGDLGFAILLALNSRVCVTGFGLRGGHSHLLILVVVREWCSIG